MPRLIEVADDRAIDLAGCGATLDANGFDPGDEDSLAAAALLLRRLANNRSFLAEAAALQLAGRWRGEAGRSGYSAQALMLHRTCEGHFIRAALWPAPGDAIFAKSGGAPFNFDVPHDHNFSFLTVGYHGPGYGSDYYEYDHRHVAGHVGERVALRFVERSCLSEGRMLLYRAHRDVHRQLPPAAFSVSLNIMHMAPDQPWRDQYRFDLDSGTIAARLTHTPAESLLALACHMGLAEGRDIADRFAAAHPCERVRLSAFEALVTASAGQERADWARRAEASGSALVRAEARRWRAAAEA